MKKIFGIALTLCLLVAAPAYSQFNWGIKAGVNLAGEPSSLKETGFSREGKNGFFVGPMAKVIIPVLNIGLEGNLLYSQTGAELGGSSVKRHSLDLPIYLRYDFALPIVNKFLEPFIAVGPQFSWLISGGDISGMNEIWDAASGTFMDSIYEWEYKKSNLSLNLGAGATILNHIQLHINYNIALGDTGEWKENALGQAWGHITGSKTNTWQVSAAYIF